jgi:VanZ family protein
MCWLTGRGMNAVMALGMAVAAGFIVSFGVEYLQAFLPSRDSSLRDLITNGAGTLIGSIGYLGIRRKA